MGTAPHGPTASLQRQWQGEPTTTDVRQQSALLGPVPCCTCNLQASPVPP